MDGGVRACSPICGGFSGSQGEVVMNDQQIKLMVRMSRMLGITYMEWVARYAEMYRAKQNKSCVCDGKLYNNSTCINNPINL